MAARAKGSGIEVLFAFESTYGTGTGLDYIKVPIISSTLGLAQGLIPDDILGLGREPQAPIDGEVEVSGDIVVPVDEENFGWWLKAAHGDIAATGVGPYTWGFDSSQVPISFAVELGYTDLATPQYFLFEGCYVNSYNISQTRGGALQATISIIGQDGTRSTSSVDASPAANYAVQRFLQSEGVVKRNDSNLGLITGTNFTFSNNMEALPTITANGLIEDADPGIASFSGQMTARFSDATLLQDAENKTEIDLEFAFTKGTSSMTFTANRTRLPQVPQSVNGPGGVEMTFDFQSAQQSDGNPMLLATLVNDTADGGYDNQP